MVYVNDRKGGLIAGFSVSDPARVPYAMTAGDLNKDGKPEIVLGYTTGPLSVFVNDGTGRRFTERRFGDAKGSAYGFAIGDVDRDGWPDIRLPFRSSGKDFALRAGDRISLEVPEIKPEHVAKRRKDRVTVRAANAVAQHDYSLWESGEGYCSLASASSAPSIDSAKRQTIYPVRAVFLPHRHAKKKSRNPKRLRDVHLGLSLLDVLATDVASKGSQSPRNRRSPSE